VAEETATPESADAEPAKAKGGGLKLALVAVISLVAGTAAGAFGVGPVVAGAMHGDPAAAEEAGGHGAPKKGGGGHGGGGGEDVSLYAIDNVVVNPAGTQGTRFLVVSLALRLTHTGTTEELVAHDPEIRDALLGLLSSRTVEQLSNPTSRDSLKIVLKTTIESVIGAGKIESILLPQFVLQ
jgi:flagellar FliL protein